MVDTDSDRSQNVRTSEPGDSLLAVGLLHLTCNLQVIIAKKSDPDKMLMSAVHSAQYGLWTMAVKCLVGDGPVSPMGPVYTLHMLQYEYVDISIDFNQYINPSWEISDSNESRERSKSMCRLERSYDENLVAMAGVAMTEGRLIRLRLRL